MVMRRLNVSAGARGLARPARVRVRRRCAGSLVRVHSPGDLTGDGRRDGPGRLRLGIPIYADPDVHPEIWAGVERAPAGSLVIINPDSGAGAFLDARYRARVEAAQALGHVVFGYVDTAYGERPGAAAAAEIARHQSWFGVDGVFFDQVAGTPDRLWHYAHLAALARARGLAVAFNMGQANVDRGLADLADVIAVFEGPSRAYAETRFPDWMHDRARRTRLWHLVFDAPDEHALRTALERAAAGPCEVIFVTDGTAPNPWCRLPAYWDRELALVGASRPAGDQ